MTKRIAFILVSCSILASTLTQAFMVHFLPFFAPPGQLHTDATLRKSSALLDILPKKMPDSLNQAVKAPDIRRITTESETDRNLKTVESEINAYEHTKDVRHLTASLNLLAKAGALVKDHEANLLIMGAYFDIYKLADADMNPNFEAFSPNYLSVSRIAIPSESEMASNPAAKTAYDAAVTENERRQEYINQQVQLKNFIQLYTGMFANNIRRTYQMGRAFGSHAELQQLLDQHPELDTSLKAELLAALSYDEVEE